MKERFKFLLAIGLIVTALAVAGKLDYQSQADEAKHYCDMVKSGAWPDYAHRGDDC